MRTCRCTPPQTCGKHLSNGSLVTHQIWTQSGQPLWSYRGRGCLRHPLPGTCHVPWQAPVGIGTGQIRNLLNGDIEQRRPLVNRSTRSRDISFSKASWGRVGSGWVGSGRVGSGRAAHTEISPLNYRGTRSALRAPLVITYFYYILPLFSSFYQSKPSMGSFRVVFFRITQICFLIHANDTQQLTILSTSWRFRGRFREFRRAFTTLRM